MTAHDEYSRRAAWTGGRTRWYSMRNVPLGRKSMSKTTTMAPAARIASGSSRRRARRCASKQATSHGAGPPRA
eukprot:6466565-Lingulodinium_polyedra.AAC.1